MKRTKVFSVGAIAGIAGTAVMTMGTHAGAVGALNADSLSQPLGQNQVTQPQSTGTVSVPNSNVSSQSSISKKVATSKTAVGTSVFVNFGYVQVKVTAKGKKIIKIQTLQTPNQDGRSMMIAQYSVPILRKEALAAQSAKIASVSGASYTSYGYKQSLQSALTKLGL
jgi:uncharacterized protein with FMN-binding domain